MIEDHCLIITEASSGDLNKKLVIPLPANHDLLLFDKKVTLVVKGLEPLFDRILRQRTRKGNALIIVEYTNTAKREINIIVLLSLVFLISFKISNSFHNDKIKHHYECLASNIF